VVNLEAILRDGAGELSVSGVGNGPISAFSDVLRKQDVDVKVNYYLEHTLSASGDAFAAAYIELEVNGQSLWGVGIDGDITIASIKALISAVNRALRA
jgi:2-isopropylmalate synthase